MWYQFNISTVLLDYSKTLSSHFSWEKDQVKTSQQWLKLCSNLDSSENDSWYQLFTQTSIILVDFFMVHWLIWQLSCTPSVVDAVWQKLFVTDAIFKKKMLLYKLITFQLDIIHLFHKPNYQIKWVPEIQWVVFIWLRGLNMSAPMENKHIY